MDLEAKGLPCLDVSAVAPAWDRFVESFLEGYFERNPTFAVSSGRHDFDGRLPDWSPEGLEEKTSWLRAERERALAFDPGCLDERRLVEREAVIAQLDGELFWTAGAEQPWRNPAYYAFSLDPAVYLTRPYAPLEQRMRAYVDYARAVPEAAVRIRTNLRTPMPRAFVQFAEMAFSGLADYYEKDVPPVFAAVDDPDLQAAMREAGSAAAAAMRGLGAWFTGQAASSPEEGYALGADLYRRMLRETERVDVSLEELEAAGRRELERNLEDLRQACAALAPGVSVEECLARVQAMKPPEGPVQAARRQLAGLRRFVEETELVSIPGTPADTAVQVEESPPYQRWNSAYIDIPGPYDRHLPAIYYISPPEPSWSAEERAAYVAGEADLLFITAHEIWPGHFLQFLHSNRAESPVGRLFVGYGFAEGWAHYSEELIWEAGFGAGDPVTRIGQLQNALLRNVRYLAAIGLHTGRMTVAEAERMFVEQGFQDAANARQQAARGTFDPAYLNYTLGKLMVRKLRQDWTEPRGGRAAWREFHDRFLSYGGPPVPVVRSAMLGSDVGSLL